MKRLLSTFLFLSLLLSTLLALASPGDFLRGWIAYSALLIPCTFALIYFWRKFDGTKSLAVILVTAFLIRILLGISLTYLLPAFGYDSPTQQAGYLFYDAQRRDEQAWDLAISGNSIFTAFGNELVSDQYGGLLALSAILYRYLSPDVHRSLLVVVLGSFMSALGAGFAYLSARKLRDEKFAIRATWIVALFPDAVMLGASQMREPFLIAFTAMAFYGLIAWLEDRSSQQWIWIAISATGMLLISPAIIPVVLIALAGWVWISDDRRHISWKMIAAFAVVLLFGLFALAYSWGRFVSTDAGALGVIGAWIKESTKWSVYTSNSESGIVQLILDSLPSVLHIPFLGLYGITQPVLPAALIETTTNLWRVIGVTRSLAWYVLLPLLMYAPFAAWRDKDSNQRRSMLWLALVVWVWMIIASVRGGGDQWDNPRYRAILILFQSFLAVYAWDQFRMTRDRWLMRIVAIEIVSLLIFTNWYTWRYLQIGIAASSRPTILLALALAVLIPLGDWAWERWRLSRR